jgi:hypothetical protein
VSIRATLRGQGDLRHFRLWTSLTLLAPIVGGNRWLGKATHSFLCPLLPSSVSFCLTPAEIRILFPKHIHIRGRSPFCHSRVKPSGMPRIKPNRSDRSPTPSRLVPPTEFRLETCVRPLAPPVKPPRTHYPQRRKGTAMFRCWRSYRLFMRSLRIFRTQGRSTRGALCTRPPCPRMDSSVSPKCLTPPCRQETRFLGPHHSRQPSVPSFAPPSPPFLASPLTSTVLLDPLHTVLGDPGLHCSLRPRSAPLHSSHSRTRFQRRIVEVSAAKIFY